MLVWSSQARAGEASLRISTDDLPAEANCPDTDSLSRRVRALRPAGLGFGRANDAPRLDIVFAREPDGTLRANLTASAPIAGERTLFDKGTGCAALGEAVAVTVALLLDGTNESERRPVADLAVAEQAGPPEAGGGRAASGQILLAAGLTDGTVTKLAPRFGLELVAHPTGRTADRTIELGFGFGYVPGGASALGAGRVTSSAAFGTARTGIRFGIGGQVHATGARAFALVPSLTFAAGSVRAEGQGFDEDRATSRAFARVGASLPLSFEPGGPFVLRLAPSVDVATRRQSFVVSGVDDRVTIPRVSVTMLGFIGFSFL